MFPSHSVKHPPQRKTTANGQRPPPISRSGSFLNTIRTIVTAPLSWFAGNDEFEDDGDGKRKRTLAINGVVQNDTAGTARKKMRLQSPPRASGYLDPPESSLRVPRRSPQRYTSPLKLNVDAGQPSPLAVDPMVSAFPMTRTMSIDPPSRHSTTTHDHKPSASFDFSMGRTQSISMSRDMSLPPPFRVRTSLTPQPSPSKPARREASAPPPLASLMSNPIFVRPPPEPVAPRPLNEQRTMSLGSLVDFQRSTRSPSRGPSLLSSSSSTSFSNNVRVTNVAERTLHELDVYKTPIVPTRYKEAKVIPSFLKPKKVHVPIPMTGKERGTKPSLGMKCAEKAKESEKGGGKPYSGQGGLSKLLARRRAEEEEERLVTAMDRDDESAQTTKRDVGVSAKLTSDTEEDRSRSFAANEVPPLPAVPSADDPTFVNGRDFSFERLGRKKTARSDPRHPAPLRLRNRFSAAYDEEDGNDDISMHSSEGPASRSRDDLSGMEEQPEMPRVFEPPAGFSFAKDTVPIEHKLDGAKEPPLSSLPFSFNATPSGTTTTNEQVKPQTPSFFAQPSQSAPKDTPLAAPPVSSSPFSFPSSGSSTSGSDLKTGPSAIKETAAPTTTPTVAITPPTPQPKPSIEITTPSLFAGNAAASADHVAKKPSSIPNFFANSAFIANKPANSSPLATAAPLTPSPPAPIKDADNPFWDGDKPADPLKKADAPATAFKESAGSSLFANAAPERPKSAEPKPSPFGGFSKPFSTQSSGALGSASTSSAPPFGSATKNPEASLLFGASKGQESSMLFGAPPKVDETKKPASQPARSPFSFAVPPTSINTSLPFSSTPASPFLFGKAAELPEQSSSSTTRIESPKPLPLFGAGPTASSANTPTTVSPFSFATPPATANVDAKASPSSDVPKPLFGFSFPNASETANAPSIAAGVEAEKSPFAFGAPPSTPPSGTERKDPFGATTSTNTGFTFGAPSSSASTATPNDSSPFKFGSQARPSTPPKQDNTEMRMDESPTRDETGKLTTGNKPTGGFTFGTSSDSTPFGQSNTVASPFTFGTSGSSPSLGVKPEEPKSTGFGNFNRTTSAPALSTTFSFGQKSDDKGPASATGFGSSNPFSQPAVSTTTPFSFGTTNTGPSNPFAQPAHANSSAPNSPSTFAQPSPFAFSTPTSTPTNPFNFGSSQPSSPAAGALPLSPATTNVPFAFGQPSGTQTPTFGAAPSSGALFNIGAPPPPAPGSGTPRQVKKLPRRGAGKR